MTCRAASLPLLRIMREHAPHFALFVEFHQLCRAQAVDASVFQNATPHTGIKRDEVEPQSGVRLQTAREIVTQRRLATQHALPSADKPGDERRAKFHIVRVTGEDSLQVMCIPGRDPLLGVTGKIECEHILSSCHDSITFWAATPRQPTPSGVGSGQPGKGAIYRTAR